MQVFLSVGRVATAEQDAFLGRLETKLRVLGLDPRTIGRNTFSSGQPLDRIKETMKASSGLIVLAFERTRAQRGVEIRSAKETPYTFTERRYATPWHHIELAMANMLGLPILVVLEKGVHEEGLLEDKYGWYVYRTKLELQYLETPEFSGLLDHWLGKARAYVVSVGQENASHLLTAEPGSEAVIDVSGADSASPATKSIGRLLKELRPGEFWATAGAAVVLLSGSFAAGNYINGLKSEKVATTPSVAGAGPPSGDTAACDFASENGRAVRTRALRLVGVSAQSPQPDWGTRYLASGSDSFWIGVRPSDMSQFRSLYESVCNEPGGFEDFKVDFLKSLVVRQFSTKTEGEQQGYVCRDSAGGHYLCVQITGANVARTP